MDLNRKLNKNPSLIICVSFAIVIFVGTILLNLPIASKSGHSIGLIDALFTATSATCVTGLVVVNTARYWTIFGKVVIILLIQIGGLGTMTIISLVSIALKRKITLSQRILIKEQMNSISFKGMVRLVKYVLSFSLLTESAGAIILCFKWIPKYGLKQGLAFSIFHSISAFCNAGFDIFGNSLEDFTSDITVNLVIMLLVIIGGIGFTVVSDMYYKRNFKNFSLHTKLVLSMTAVLIVLGTVQIFILEYGGVAMKNFTTFDKFLGSLFTSVIARTAGFNTVDLAKLRGATALLVIILMFIGASPASTGGGLKTTTFGVLLFSTIAVLRGKKDVVVFKKTIPTRIVLKSLCILFVAFTLVIFISIALTLIEDDAFPYIDILFETVSAFGTVGLSRGITSDLSMPSRILISFLMYLGRVGPTTLAVGLFRKAIKGYTRYSEGTVIVG